MVVSCAAGFVESVVHIRTMFSRATSLDDFLDDAFECTDAHTSLAMSCQSIVPGEGIAACTGVWLAARVDLGVAFEVVASNKALVAVVAAELTIAKMCLDMRLDVFFAAELFVAVFVFADPFVVAWVWSFNELSDVVESDIGFFDRG